MASWLITLAYDFVRILRAALITPNRFGKYHQGISHSQTFPPPLERISYLLGIHKALSIIFSADLERAYAWVSKPNLAPPFNGKSARAYMLQGRVVDLADVRRYLDGL